MELNFDPDRGHWLGRLKVFCRLATNFIPFKTREMKCLLKPFGQDCRIVWMSGFNRPMFVLKPRT